MARPTKLTPEVEAKLIEGIAVGLSYALAAYRAGIDPDTFAAWRKRGDREPSSEYGEFLGHIKEAEGDAAFKWLQKMDSLPQGWQAMAWKLERRHPEDYALKKDDAAEKLLRMIVGNGNPV